MPWTADDAEGHTSHANTPHKRKQWAAVANAALKGGHKDASAIRIANAAVHKMNEQSDIVERVAKYLSEHAPDIYEIMKKQLPEEQSSLWFEGKDGHYYRKDMTAGDAHVTTALGNEDKKKKKPKISVAYTQDNKDDELTEKILSWNARTLQKLADEIDPPTTDLPFKVTKIDADQQKVFGWAFVSQRGDYLLVDKQGDIILPEDLELGAHDFALHSRSQGDMHNATDGIPNRHGDMIESMVFTREKLEKAGLSAIDPDTGQQMFGWFVGFKVDDPTLWEAHKRGERPEFSIGGRGRRVEVDFGKKKVHKQNGSRSIQIIRHGATNLNNDDVSVDRIRGWANVPLSDDGREEALRLADMITSNPPDVLVSSDLERALDTAKIISNCANVPIGMVTEGLRPWNVGMYSGQTTKDAIPVLADYVRTAPDEQLPDGESFDTFRERFFETMAQILDKFDGTIGIVTHHRGERLLEAWQAAGFPEDGSIDVDEFCQPGNPTGSINEMTIEPAEVQQAAAANE